MASDRRTATGECYQACQDCCAKWFTPRPLAECPRCSGRVLTDRNDPPWSRVFSVGQSFEGQSMNECDHTLKAIDETGVTTGSWVIRETGAIRRVECGVCGKFYGRIPTNPNDQKRANQAYLEQQRRRACPGCGEEPFLG